MELFVLNGNVSRRNILIYNWIHKQSDVPYHTSTTDILEWFRVLLFLGRDSKQEMGTL